MNSSTAAQHGGTRPADEEDAHSSSVTAQTHSNEDTESLGSSTTQGISLPKSARMSISVMMPLFSLGVSFFVIACIFGALLLSVQQSVSASGPLYSDDIINKTAFDVKLYFDYFQKISTVTEQAMATDYFFDNFWDPSTPVEWFGKYVTHGVHTTVSLENGYVGYTVSPYAPLNPIRFPAKAGYCVLHRNNASAPFVGIGYFSLSTFLPSNVTSLFYLDYSAGSYNVSVRPFYAQIRSRRKWTAPFVSILTSTAAYTAGGPIYRSVNGTKSLFATYAHTTFSVDVIAHLRSLIIFKTGAVVLIDTKTQAFIGGNVEDNTTMILPNGRMTLNYVANLTDPRVHPLRQHAATLMNCASPCKFVFDVSTGILASRDGWTSRFLNDFVLVNVISVNDTYGLDLRLVVLISSHDFYADIRRAALIGELCAVGAALVLAFATFLVVNRGMTPFNNTYRTIVALSNYCMGRRDPTALKIVSKVVAARRKSKWSWISEVAAVERFVDALAQEMLTVAALLPQTTRHESTTAMENPSRSAVSTITSQNSQCEEMSLTMLKSSVSACSSQTMLSDTIVTYVCGDLRGFQAAHEELLPQALHQFHAEYIDIVKNTVEKHNGVLDRFFGDHVFIHYNASKRVPRHTIAAARTILDCQQLVHHKLSKHKIVFGMATTRAWAGVMGTTALSSYHVVGRCVQQAFLLCWGAKLQKQMTFVARNSARFILQGRLNDLSVRHIRLAILPGESEVDIVSSLITRSGVAHASPEVWNHLDAANAAYVAYLSEADDTVTRGLCKEACLPNDDWLMMQLQMQ